jgi:hypothetical protein
LVRCHRAGDLAPGGVQILSERVHEVLRG